MDYIFIGGGLEWNVFVRVVPNQSGSTTPWIFMRPNGLNDNQFDWLFSILGTIYLRLEFKIWRQYWLY
jgi:hypothetical protein